MTDDVQKPNPLTKALPVHTQVFAKGVTNAVSSIKDAWNSFSKEDMLTDAKTGFEIGTKRRKLLDNFTAESSSLKRKRAEDIKRVNELTGEEVQTNPFFNFEGQERQFQEQITELKKKNPNLEVRSVDDIYSELGAEARDFLETEEQFDEESGFIGAAAKMGGTAVGAFNDPVDAAVTFIPYGRGATLITKMASEAAISGAAEFGLQAFQVQDYKARLGLESGLGEAVKEAAIVGGAAGVFRGGGELIAKAGKSVRKAFKPKSNLDKQLEQDETILKSYMAAKPFDKMTETEKLAVLTAKKEIDNMKQNPYGQTPAGQSEYMARQQRVAQYIRRGKEMPSFPVLSPEQVEAKHAAITLIKKDRALFDTLIDMEWKSSAIDGMSAKNMTGQQKISNLIDGFSTRPDHPVAQALDTLRNDIDAGVPKEEAAQKFSTQISELSQNNQLLAKDASLTVKETDIDDIEDLTTEFAAKEQNYTDFFVDNEGKTKLVTDDAGREYIDLGDGQSIDADIEVPSDTFINDAGEFITAKKRMGDLAVDIGEQKTAARQLLKTQDSVDDTITKTITNSENATVLRNLANNIKQELKEDGVPDSELEGQLRKRLSEEMTFNAETKALRSIGTTKKRTEITDRIAAWKGERGEDKFVGQQVEFIFNDIEKRHQTIRGQALKRYSKSLEKYRPKWAGLVQSQKGQDNIIRSLYGEQVDDPIAAGMAAEFPDTLGFLRKRSNSSGAGIREKDNYVMPRFHDRQAIFRTGEQEFVKDYSKWMDWDKARRPDGTKVPADQREKVLSDIWKTLGTGGNNKIGKRGTSTSDFMRDERFIAYKNADAHLESIKKYGGGKSVHEVMINHIDKMSKYTAGMEVLGFDTFGTKETLKGIVKKDAADISVRTGKDIVNKGKKSADFIDALYDHSVSFKDIPPNMWMKSVKNIKAISYAGLLGNTTAIALPTDLAKLSNHMAIEHLPTTRMFRLYVDAFKGDKNFKKAMTRMAVVNEAALTSNTGAARLYGDLDTAAPLLTKSADVANRLSFLTPHTQATRFAAAAETNAQLLDFKGTGFDDLPVTLKERFKASKIEKEDWDLMRNNALDDEIENATFMNPESIRDIEDLDEFQRNGVADKFLDMMNDNMFMSVIERRIRSEAFLKGKKGKGPVQDAMSEVTSTFLSYPVTSLQKLREQMSRKGSAVDKWTSAAGTATALAAGTFLGVEAQEIAKGRDPASAADPEILSRMLGNFVPLFDGMMYSAGTYGKGTGDVAFSSVGSFIDDSLGLTVGTAKKLASGENLIVKDGEVTPESEEGQHARIKQDVFDFAKRWSPNINNPLTKTVYERMMWDKLEEWAVGDDLTFERRERKIKNAYADRNQTMFAPPKTHAQQPSFSLGKLDVKKAVEAPEFGKQKRVSRQERLDNVKNTKALRKQMFTINELDAKETLSNSEKKKYNSTVDKIRAKIKNQELVITGGGVNGLDVPANRQMFSKMRDLKKKNVRKKKK